MALIVVVVITGSLLPAQAAAAPSAQGTVGVNATAGGDTRPAAYLNAALAVDRRVADLLGRMTLAEKIGQMTQAERAPSPATRRVIARLRLGSVLSGGGSTPTPNTPAAWVAMVNSFQAQALSTRLQIPLIYGIDAVHGHGNVIRRHDLPAQHRPRRHPRPEAGRAGRPGRPPREMRATGIPWNFSPCVCVARDERWGRTYESFGEDPALVTSMETIDRRPAGRRERQLDDDQVLATAKHFAGDGDTDYGSGHAAGGAEYTIDQGVTITNRPTSPGSTWRPIVPRCGGTTSAASCRRSPASTGPRTASATRSRCTPTGSCITDVLKGKIGFDGFVISDWEGIHQIPDPAEPTNGGLTAHKVRVGVNAGTDMFMEPFTAKQFQDLLLAEVTAGRVSQRRIDDAVRRILRKKFELGLFEQPYASVDNLGRVGSRRAPALARRAAAESQVLLKNRGNVLPLRPGRQGLRRRPQRRQHRQPGGRLDHHVAGPVRGRTARHDGPGGHPRGRPAGAGHVQRGRVGTDGRRRRRRRGCRRDAVLGGVRRRRWAAVGVRPGRQRGAP